MGEIYTQIIRTYIQRKLFLFPLGAATVVFWLTASQKNLVGRSLFWLIVLPLFASYLVIHVKEQIASPRAKLTPNYRLPHLVVALMASIVLIVLLTLWVSVNESASLLSAGALFSITFLGVAWLQFRNWWALWLTLPMLFVIFSRPVQDWLRSLLAGDMPGVAGGMLAASIVALLTLGVRYMKLNEEMAEYDNVTPMNPWNLRPRDERRQWRNSQRLGPGWLTSLFTGSSRIGPLDRPWGTGLWARARLWRMGMGTMNPVIKALLLITVMLVLCLIPSSSEPQHFQGGARTPTTFTEKFFAGTFIYGGFLFPVITSASASIGWMRRLSRLGYESLRPTNRRRFIREIALGFTIDMWAPWFVFMLAFGASVAMLGPETLFPGEVGYFLLWSVSFPLIAYFLTAFLSIYRSIALTMSVITMTWAALFFFGMSKAVARDSSGVLWYFSLLAGAGVVLVAFSYRNWCNADLD